MRSLAFLPTAVSLCSALVIPSQDVLLDVFSKDPFATERASYTKLLGGASQIETSTKSPWTSFIPLSEQSDESLIQSAISLGLGGSFGPNMKILQAEEPNPGPGPGPGPEPSPGYPEHPRPPGPPGPPGNPHEGEPHRRHCKDPALCPGSSSIWELLSQSPRTARLAELIRDDEDLVKLLSSTSENYTIFAPTNRALDHPMGQLELPSLSNILRYHIVPGRLSLEDLRVYLHQTLPTILNGPKEKSLDEEKKKKKDDDKHKDKDKDLPQRLRIDALRGSILVNGASEIVTGDIIAKNGIIHYIDVPLTPPPNTSTLLRLFPEHFSTFALALSRTNLESHFDSEARYSGTIFAPTNRAFRVLGPRVNAFLFSPQGEECLRSLLQYHIVPDKLIYSDAVHGVEGVEEFGAEGDLVSADGGLGHDRGEKERYPIVHVESSTLLKGHDLSLDVLRRGPEAEARINGFWEPHVVDVLARDGVIHVLDQLLIPPKMVGKETKGKGLREDLVVEILRGQLEIEDYEKLGKPRGEL